MMQRWHKVAVLGAIFGAVGGLALTFTRKAQATTTSSGPKRVALIGDSYAVGLGPELEKRLPVFQYEGHVNSRPFSWASLPSWVAAFRPDVVLVSLGVNDGATPKPSQYQTIVRNIHGLGARVIWIEPPAAVRAPEVRSTISALGVSTMPATHTPLAADGLHPRAYAPWAEEIARAIG